ncbi:hypothetical protein JOD54_002159 [Actinokineospora baliensis]|uniref:hypothetical protein n=1 Tax=Actinokineospora baliensis TaxID=547056 RepID=UPI00195BBFDE|nr:hypothetical protein [Actinokineospora baliensis]MBM7771955.1 hypothetical protein [Actinokineospora baliensis]
MDTKTERLRSAAGTVVLALGAGWRLNLGRGHEHLIYIDGPENMKIKVRFDEKINDRLVFEGAYPQSTFSQLGHVDTVSIGVYYGRDPKVIVREIHRRLLPDYRVALDNVIDRLNRDIDETDRRTRALDNLARQLPGARVADRRLSHYADARVPGGTWTVDRDGSNLNTIELKNVPLALALKIARLVGGTR